MQIPIPKFVKISSSENNRRIMIKFSFIKQWYFITHLFNFPEQNFCLSGF